MAEEYTAPKEVASKSYEAFVEAPKKSTMDQSGILDEKYLNVSVPHVTQEISSAPEIDQDSGLCSNVIGPYNSESNSTPVPSGVSQEEQEPAEDDPTVPLVLSRYKEATATASDAVYRDYQPPPPRPSLIECMCCGISTTYNIHENGQEFSNYIHYTRKVRNSKYILLVLVALLTVPISSIYFGVTYKGSCPMVQFCPLFLVIMGIVGVIFIVVRLMTISTRRRLWDLKEPPKTLSISLTFMLMIFMAMEMITFYSQKPDFGNPKYPIFCEKVFYDYVFYMNFAVLIILAIALMLHIPVKNRSPLQVATRV